MATNATRFRVDLAAGTVEGPADYLASDNYRDCIARLKAGTSAVFNVGVTQGIPTDRLVEVVLQTDFAAWRGAQSFAAMARG